MLWAVRLRRDSGRARCRKAVSTQATRIAPPVNTHSPERPTLVNTGRRVLTPLFLTFGKANRAAEGGGNDRPGRDCDPLRGPRRDDAERPVERAGRALQDATGARADEGALALGGGGCAPRHARRF